MTDVSTDIEKARTGCRRSQVSPAGPAEPADIRVGIGESRIDGGAQTCVVRLRGEVDARTLVQLEERCSAELTLGTTALVLDFDGMTACPSALFMVLSRISKSLRRRSASLELVGLWEAVAAIVSPGRQQPEG